MFAKVVKSVVKSSRGDCFNLVEAALTIVAKSMHEALLLRRVDVVVFNTASTFAVTFAAASLFANPVAISAVRLSTELAGEQSEETVMTSSSRLLQALYAALHGSLALVALASNSLGMQLLFTFAASSFSSGFNHNAQAALSVSVLFPASTVLPLNAFIVSRQASSSAVVVAFNLGA